MLWTHAEVGTRLAISLCPENNAAKDI